MGTERVTAIKARLLDLHYHNCPGSLEIGPDGLRKAVPCQLCAEHLRLVNELHELHKTANAVGSGQ